MVKIEIIYDSDCPNVALARMNLEKALADAAGANQWTEWERSQASAPIYVQRYGSPTILIDGNPVGKNDANEEGRSCSLYHDEQGKVSRVPSVAQIRSAIQEATVKQKNWSIIGVLSSSGSGLLALIPFISCPLCWPAYTSLLSALGIGFFNYSLYLIPFLIGLIGLSAFSMWRDYRFHGRFFPLLLALIGGTFIVATKTLELSNPLLYVGIVCLLVASIANIFYVKMTLKKSQKPCKSCCQKKEEKSE